MKCENIVQPKRQKEQQSSPAQGDAGEESVQRNVREDVRHGSTEKEGKSSSLSAKRSSKTH